MQTVLVVEDEKLIRQGITAMLKRCGVPVGEIIECPNGVKAMEVLREKKVDVMFTDIRMPKMNGIELVKAMQELEKPPVTIAVSGYDDFSYAVEMMRQGVREYILKPVERDKLREIMEKLEAELSRKQETEIKNEKLEKKFLKYFLTDAEESEEDLEVLGKRIKADVGEDYRILVMTENDDLKKELQNTEPISEIEGNAVYIIGNTTFETIKKNYLDEESSVCSIAGISDSYTETRDLKKAYLQAKSRREQAFFGQELVYSEDDKINVPKQLLDNGKKLCEKSAISARVQLMGTDRTDALEKEWNGFFTAARRCQITPSDFIEAISFFDREYTAVYKKSIPEELKNPLLFCSLTEYKDAFLEMIFEENTRHLEKSSEDIADRKIQKAVSYIKENYRTDINMAVISNQVSMNYSLFSTAFKNYTGTNFVSYVRSLRIDEAKRLLLETDLRVNEIGAKVGYDNDKQFMKNFKAVVGVSPSEYRKNMAD
jgi:YesN/AraC family two-component response regulator